MSSDVALAGVPIRLTGVDAEMLASLRAPLPDRVTSEEREPVASISWGEETGRFTVSADHEMRYEGPDRTTAFSRFESTIHLLVAAHADELVFVHAGVVALDGMAVVLPGRSGRGKSTLVQALVTHGASFMSDEYAVLDQAGRVKPFPRPLHLRRADGSIDRVDPETIGEVGAREPLPIGAVVSTSYEPDTEPTLRAVGRTDGLGALIDNAVAVRRNPDQVMRIAGDALAGARCFAGFRGAADVAAREIIGVLR